MKRANIILPALALLCAAVTGLASHAAPENLPGLEVQPASYFFTGKPYDEDLGAYAFAFRNYSPSLTRWTTPDPSGFPDGINNHSYHPTPTIEVDLWGLLTIAWNYSDGVNPGETFPTIGIESQGAVRTQKVGDCWVAVVDQGFVFTGSGYVILPKVGESYSFGGHTGVFDQIFHDTSAQHEGWHVTQINNMVDKTYTALETWTANYSSNKFTTQLAAKNAGMADFAGALALVESRFPVLYRQGEQHAGKTAPTGFSWNATAGTWRSDNPNWGGIYNQKISEFSLIFEKTKGDCE